MAKYAIIIPMVVLVALLLLRVGHVHCADNSDCGQQLCGDVIIEYPFGIGSNCSFDNDYFAVTCDNSSDHNNPKAILTKVNLELVEVQKYYDQSSWGYMTVRIPIVKVCNDPSESIPPGSTIVKVLDLINCPFSVEDSGNTFVSVGCLGKAALYDWSRGRAIAGCKSSCNPPGKVIDGGCNGYYCCRSNLNVGVQGYSVQFINDDIHVLYETTCRSAFLISKTFFHAHGNTTLSIAMADHAAVPVVLRWDSDWMSHTDDQDNIVLEVVLIYIIPIGLVTLLVSGCILWSWRFWKTKERRKMVKLREKYFKEELEKNTIPNGNQVMAKLFTIKEIKKATNNFSEGRVLGHGGDEGRFYKGMLADGDIVAIKELKKFGGSKESDKWKELTNEVILLSQMSHRNVVKLRGCCLETETPYLVYEFVHEGTLSQHVHKLNDQVSLTWDKRLKISCDVASALDHLHSSSSSNKKILHRNVKSTNILLDYNYQAKLADFGISRGVCMDQTRVSMSAPGTSVYLDRECLVSGKYSEKSDVYSFGVILVELLTGKDPSLAIFEEFITAMNLLPNATKFDANLALIVQQETTRHTIMAVANIAKRCLQRELERPTMKEVAILLEGLAKKTDAPLSKQGVSKSNTEEFSACPTTNFDINQCEEEQALLNNYI